MPTRGSRFTTARPQPCAAAKYPRRELNPQRPAPHAGASAVGLRGREPPSGADPDHLPYEGKVTAVCDGAAAGQGLEPRLAASEAAVLPLDDPALSTGGGSRTRTSEAHQDLSLARLPVTPRPRAPPGNRTPYRRIKSPVLHRYSSRRRRGPPGDRTLLSGLEGRYIATMLAGQKACRPKGL